MHGSRQRRGATLEIRESARPNTHTHTRYGLCIWVASTSFVTKELCEREVGVCMCVCARSTHR